MSRAHLQTLRKLATGWGRHPMAREVLTGVLLLLVLLLGIQARVQLWDSKQCLHHDEAISFLAAAGKQVGYKQDVRAFRNEWIDSNTLITLNTADEGFQFSRVLEGLSRTDFHPPVYFWVFHALSVLSGGRATLSIGLWLNLAAFLLSAVALFALAYVTLASRALALGTLALWALSPAVVAAGLDIRQYEALATGSLWTVLFLGVYLRYARWRPWALVGLALCLTTAVMTQLQGLALIPLIVVLAAALPLLNWWRPMTPGVTWRFSAGAVAAVVVALTTLVTVFPRYERVVKSKGKVFRRMEVPTLDEDRIDEMLGRLADFFMGPGGDVGWVLWVLVAMLLAFGVLGYRYHRATQPEQRLDALLTAVALLAFLVIGGLALRHLLSFRPGRAIAPRYLAIVFPFLALASAAAVRALVPSRFAAHAGVGLLVLVGLAGVLRDQRIRCERSYKFAGALSLYDAVVLDSVRRGSLGAVIPFLEPGRRVFVINGKPDLAIEERFAGGLEHVSSVVLVTVGRGKAERFLKKALRKHGFETTDARDPIAAVGHPDWAVLVASSGPPPSRAYAARAKLGSTATKTSVQPHIALFWRGRRIDSQQGASVSIDKQPDELPENLGLSLTARATPETAVVEIDGRVVATRRKATAMIVYDLKARRTVFADTFKRPAMRSMTGAVKARTKE